MTAAPPPRVLIVNSPDGSEVEGPDELAVLASGPNVIVTPHVAYASEEGIRAVRERVCRDFLEEVG